MRRAIAAACLLTAAAMGVAAPAAAQTPPQSSYEMEMYHVVLARKGPNWEPQSSERGMDVRFQVLNAIRKAASEGLVATAGLVNDETDVELILILRCETKTEALELVNAAPNVRNGFFEPEIYSWFAPRGLTVAEPRAAAEKTKARTGQ